MADTPDDKLTSMAQQFSGLPMKALIGGPLQAAAHAQHSLALTQTQAILETGFSRITDGNGKLTAYKPLTAAIELATTRPGAGSATPPPSALTLNLPILTMMHIPSLAVCAVNVAFDMEVKSSFSRDTDEQDSNKLDVGTSWDARAGWGGFGVELKGSLSHDTTHTHNDKQSAQRSNDARYHVEVKAEQQSMPEGLKLLRQAFCRNMDTSLAPAVSTAAPQPPTQS